MEKKNNNNGFENLHEWSERMQGAREMLTKLYEDDKVSYQRLKCVGFRRR